MYQKSYRAIYEHPDNQRQTDSLRNDRILFTERQKLVRWIEFFKYDGPASNNIIICCRNNIQPPSVAKIKAAIKKQ